MQNAEKTDGIYWQIGERLHQNPELVIHSPTEAERLEVIRGHIATREYAFIGVNWGNFGSLRISKSIN